MPIFKRDIREILPPPFQTRHSEYSMIFSLDDDFSQSSDYLISLAVAAVLEAQEVKLDDLCERMRKPPYFPNIWPGEHDKLLAGLGRTLSPKVIIEIGTCMGLSALSTKKYLPANSKIYTFDIKDWKPHPDYCLKEEDFSDGRLIQFLDDLSDAGVFLNYRSILEKATLAFIDAAKDGIMEKKFLENFRQISFAEKVVVLFDDIRLWNMLKIWRAISLPKLVLTAFGHWSGAGIVEWQ